MVHLQKSSPWYNPLYLVDGEMIRELKNIIFFADGKEVISSGHGWLEEGNSTLPEGAILPIGEIKRKNKPDLNLKTPFWIPKAKDFYDRVDKYNHAILYLPFKPEEWEIEKEGYRSQMPEEIYYYDVYKSAKWRARLTLKVRELKRKKNIEYFERVKKGMALLAPLTECKSDDDINEYIADRNKKEIVKILDKLEVK